MDYTKQPVVFQARKAARYVRLYGPRRTLVKVRGQLHMSNRAVRLPLPSPARRSDAHVGLLGCGNFGYSNLAYYLHKNYGAILRGTMDVNLGRAQSLARDFGAHYATDDASRIIDDPAIDLVFVASNHASHAPYAIRALEGGKSVHIEKPHVVDDDQLKALCHAMNTSPGHVRLGFNRPDSELGLLARRLLADQDGPAMLNWFIAGHELPPEHWYYSEAEGGRVLGNLCHWTDLVLQMIEPEHRYPIEVRPTSASVSESDIVVSYIFGDGSMAAITFSAKGHTFEGVRERLSAHRGNLLLSVSDFKVLEADILERRLRRRLLHRDHGHQDAVRRSYAMSSRSSAPASGCSVAYVWETGQLFLKTREALRCDTPIVLHSYPGGDKDHAAAVSS